MCQLLFNTPHPFTLLALLPPPSLLRYGFTNDYRSTARFLDPYSRRSNTRQVSSALNQIQKMIMIITQESNPCCLVLFAL
jgi:hypothetical protein